MVDAIKVSKGGGKAIGALGQQQAAAWLGRRRAGRAGLPLPCRSLAHLPTHHPRAEPGSWVRIKNGLYKGDLAKVVDTDPGTQVRRWAVVCERV